MEYVRQSIVCFSDPTLEVSEGGDGEWRGEHSCRNWDGLFEWAVEKRANDKDPSAVGDI